ncbi:MAG: hypothetical protein R2684_11295 [Pyrinomonadaceae bacterium]
MMVHCAYHTNNTATVNCNGCGKSLCPACDHRIKGFPYCQDCIVSGIDMLRRSNQAIFVPIVKKQTSPLFSVILSLFCPGLGAAYNGQVWKAIVHFVAFVGLFQMAISTTVSAPLFVLGFLGMWAFAALDAWRTAQAIRAGITPSAAEDVLLQRFAGNAKIWGIVLTVLGASFVLQVVFDFDKLLSRFILPALLIGIGVYLLRGFFVGEGMGTRATAKTSRSTGDAIGEYFDRDFGGSSGHRKSVEVRSWKNRR